MFLEIGFVINHHHLGGSIMVQLVCSCVSTHYYAQHTFIGTFKYFKYIWKEARHKLIKSK